MEIFKSKKFIMAMFGVVAVVLNSYVPVISEEMVMSVAALVSSYVVGQGLADLGKEAK